MKSSRFIRSTQKKVLGLVVGADVAFSQPIVALLEAKAEKQKSQSLATLFAATGESLLRERRTE